MFCFFSKNISQKELFFQINHVINNGKNEKGIKGVYAIFKNDICLYVGQSSNIASRLATHLSGKYSDSTKIFIFEQTNEEDLIINEKYCIQKLKPIENILVDYDEIIPKDKLFDFFHDFEMGAYENILDYYDFTIDIDKINILVATYNFTEDILNSSDNIKELLGYCNA